MHFTVQNLIQIQHKIKEKIENSSTLDYNPNIIAVSKTFKIENILPLINYGHIHFGENKVQEAQEKWSEIKSKNKLIKLHMIGKLQTNKVKFAIKIFDFIHSVDNIKLAKKIYEEQLKQEKKVSIFIQVNLGDEIQKSGVLKKDLQKLYDFCIEKKLQILGLMCLPPFDEESDKYFKELCDLNQKMNLKELSMGMSHDFINALNFNSTYLRIGSKIFGKRN